MKKSTTISIAAVAAIIWFALLGYRDLIEPDEGRYAEIPREMLATGDWLTPHLNGFKYFEKPVLQYWLTSVSYAIFGTNNTAARLLPALTGYLCALFVWLVGRRLFNPTAGFYAFIVTLSCGLYAALGHILTLDMAVELFMVVGVGCLVLAQSRRGDKSYVRLWMLFGWAALALATLTKGLIGLVLPGLAVVVYSLWQRDWLLWKHLHLGKGLLLFFALTAPWFVSVSMANPEFAKFFFIHEHFARYTTNVHDRGEPVWYLTVVLAIGVLPWFVPMLKSLVIPGFSWRPAGPIGSQPQTTKLPSGFDAQRFLWVFAAVVLVFFSLGHSQLPPYILPMFPVLAIFAGKHLAESGRDRTAAVIMLVIAFLLLVAVSQAEHFASDRNPLEMISGYRPWIIAAAVCYLCGAVLAWVADKRKPILLASAGLCALLAVQLLGWGFQSLASYRSSKELASVIQSSVPNGTKIYLVETYFPESLPFYLGDTIVMVNYKSELEMGIAAEPQKWIASEEEFIRRWNNSTEAVAIMDYEVYSKYLERGLPMRIIYKNPRRMAVVKP